MATKTKKKNYYKVLIPHTRGAFLYLFSKEEYKGEQKGYSMVCLLDPKREEHKDTIKELNKAIKKAAKDGGFKIDEDNNPLKDGNDKPNLDGYKNMVFIKTSSNKNRPAVYDRDKRPCTEDDELHYAGAHFDVLVTITHFSNKHGDFVAVNLEAVRFVKHDEPFGGGGSHHDADEDFPDRGEEGEEEDEDDKPKKSKKGKKDKKGKKKK